MSEEMKKRYPCPKGISEEKWNKYLENIEKLQGNILDFCSNFVDALNNIFPPYKTKIDAEKLKLIQDEEEKERKKKNELGTI